MGRQQRKKLLVLLRWGGNFQGYCHRRHGHKTRLKRKNPNRLQIEQLRLKELMEEFL